MRQTSRKLLSSYRAYTELVTSETKTAACRSLEERAQAYATACVTVL